MAHKIEIGLEVNEVKKTLLELSHDIERTFGKSKSYDLFSSATRDFLLREATKAIKDIKSELGRLSGEAKKYQDILNKTNQTDASSIKLKMELLRIEGERVKRAEELAHLQRANNNFEKIPPSSLLPALYDKARSGLPTRPQEGMVLDSKTGALISGGGSMPPVRGGGSPAKSGGGRGGVPTNYTAPFIDAAWSEGGGAGAAAAGGGLALAAAGIAAIVAGIFIKVLTAGWKAFEGSVDQRVKLLGRGITNTSGRDPYLNGRLGFDPTEIRAAQESGMGIFGAGASQLGSAGLKSRMRFGRQMGFSSSEVDSPFAQVQGAGGFNQANRTFEEFKATVFSNKLEHALAPYFEAISGILAQINENGLGLNGEAFQAIAKIAGTGENVSAQQAGKLVGGLDQFIKTASGGTQALLMQAFSSKGIGGRTLGGAQSAVEMGLFGGGSNETLQGLVDQKLLSRGDMSKVLGLGLGGNGSSGRRAGAVVKALSTQMQRFPGAESLGPNATEDQRRQASNEQWIAQSRFLMTATGSKNVIEAREKYNALTAIANATSPQKAKSLSDAYDKKFGDKDIGKIMDTSEGHLKQIQSNTKATLEKIGKDIAPAVLVIKEILVNLLGGAAKVTGGFRKAIEWRDKTEDQIVGGIKRLFGHSDVTSMDADDQNTESAAYYKKQLKAVQDRMETDKNDPVALKKDQDDLAHDEKMLKFFEDQIVLHKQAIAIQQEQLELQKHSKNPRPKAEKSGAQSTKY